MKVSFPTTRFGMVGALKVSNSVCPNAAAANQLNKQRRTAVLNVYIEESQPLPGGNCWARRVCRCAAQLHHHW